MIWKKMDSHNFLTFGYFEVVQKRVCMHALVIMEL